MLSPEPSGQDMASVQTDTESLAPGAGDPNLPQRAVQPGVAVGRDSGQPQVGLGLQGRRLWRWEPDIAASC